MMPTPRLPSLAPEISVLLPAYNAAATLGATLRSLQRQAHQDWECVMVDDGSTDGTRELMATVAALDPRMRTIARPHAGIVATLNAGLAECRGRFVARMDADDLMHPERLLLQRAALAAAPELCAVGCHIRIFPRRNKSAGRLAYESWLNSLTSSDDLQRDRFVECPLAHPSLFVRRETLCAFRYRDQGWPEDYDLLLRLWANGHRIGTVAKTLLYWRDEKTRLSRTDPVYDLARFVTCKAHFLAADWLGQSDHYVLWGYGDTGRTLCRALALHGKRPSHIVELHPGRLGQTIAGAPVISRAALAALRPRPTRIVASVAGAVPRAEVRQALSSLGFLEGRDFVCAA